MRSQLLAGAAALALGGASAAHETNDDAGPGRADAHGPIGVMGDHMHEKGEIMFSYRFMHMDMKGNRVGTDSIGLDDIVASVPNVNAPPPTLRVAPESMTMDMHMFGVMWAPTDRVTLMGMTSYLDKEMDHVTYMGMSGTTRLGAFTAGASGFGDTKISALVRLHDGPGVHAHAILGVSAPTGSIDEKDRVLTPMNTTPELTLPYAMQLGSGTWDPYLGATLRGRRGDVGWGVQGTALFRVMDNDADYRLGNELDATAWASYELAPAWSVSARVDAKSVGDIDGADARVTAPVQTANPAFYGGDRIDAGVGVNWIGQNGPLRGHRFAAEVMVPVRQDLNGPQLETDVVFTLGWQKAF